MSGKRYPEEFKVEAVWTDPTTVDKFCTSAPMKRRNFSPEVKRESAQLVIDYKLHSRASSEGHGRRPFYVTKWVKQLRDERQGKTPKSLSDNTGTNRNMRAKEKATTY